MDLKQQYIKRDRQIAKEYAQITFDDDYIVKDNKPDILKVICTSGNVFVEEIKTINEAVWVSGKVNFYIIYRSDMGSMPERIDGMIPFQEKICKPFFRETFLGSHGLFFHNANAADCNA